MYYISTSSKQILYQVLESVGYCSTTSAFTVHVLLKKSYSSLSDINECQTDNGGCTQTCDNTDGSYQCSCWDGYELTSDGYSCTGIDCYNSTTSVQIQGPIILSDRSHLQ